MCIYIHICVCVCVCVYKEGLLRSHHLGKFRVLLEGGAQQAQDLPHTAQTGVKGWQKQ